MKVKWKGEITNCYFYQTLFINITLYTCATSIFVKKLSWNEEGYSLDRIKITEWIWPKSFFGLIHPFMFVIVVILIIFSIFGQIQLFFSPIHPLMFVVVKFWSSSNIKVHCCHFFWSNSNRFLVILIRSSELALINCVWYNYSWRQIIKSYSVIQIQVRSIDRIDWLLDLSTS